jgi:hypothetical protein
MTKYEQKKLRDKKVSKLIYDIEAISKELAQHHPDHIYEVFWEPRIQRLLACVIDQYATEEAASCTS